MEIIEDNLFPQAWDRDPRKWFASTSEDILPLTYKFRSGKRYNYSFLFVDVVQSPRLLKDQLLLTSTIEKQWRKWKYYLAHKYIDKTGISWFIDIELIKKSLKSIKYLVLHIWVSTIT